MSRHTSMLAASLLGLTLTAGAGCDDHDEGFADLPACVVDHADLGEAMSIAHCLVDFFDMDFADQQACVAFVTANGGYPATREEACTLYFQQRE